jgi:hypothetical protein
VTLPASQVHLSARTHDVGIQSDREVKGPQ